MKNLLIVSYLPRQERSKTKQLLDHALNVVKDKGLNVEDLDLAVDLPDLFTVERLAAYLDRDYGGQTLSSVRSAWLEKMDRMTAQLKSADALIMAYPMYNFSFPAVVKAYFDSVMLKTHTWDVSGEQYRGLLKGKSALVLSSAGGVYDQDWAFAEHSISLAKVELGFMGFDPVETVFAQGLNMIPDRSEQVLTAAKKDVEKALARMIL